MSDDQKPTSPDLVFRAIADIRNMIKELFTAHMEHVQELRASNRLAERRLHNLEGIVILHEDAIGALRERLELLELNEAGKNGEVV